MSLQKNFLRRQNLNLICRMTLLFTLKNKRLLPQNPSSVKHLEPYKTQTNQTLSKEPSEI